MVFFRSAGAGLVALGLNFILRFGMIAPFPPESAIESFLRIIPESIQEPAVQQLGDLAGDLGLIVASIVTLALYGILGVAFLRIVHSETCQDKVSELPRRLPFLFFGSLDYFWVHASADFWRVLLWHHFGICNVQCDMAFPALASICPTRVLLCDVLRVQAGRDYSSEHSANLRVFVTS